MNLAEFRAAKKRIRTAHGLIAHADIGAGEPIVLLHGVPLNSAHWRGVIGALRRDFRCIAPDLLGLGESERSERASLDFPSQAEMVFEFLDALGVSRFHLVGNDSGGAIAQIMACQAPDRVRTLTLTNCDVDANVPPPAFAQAFRLAQAGLFSHAVAGMCDNLELARSDFGLGVGFEKPRNITTELIEAYINPLVATPTRRADLDRYVAAFSNIHTVALRERLSALRIPTQLLWASDDVFFPQADALWLQRTIPGCQRLEFAAGARLFFCEERPLWVAERLGEFASKTAA